MDGRWRIEMLGGLRAVQGDRVLTRFRTQKTGALLAYLACYPQRPHLRDALIELFWPDGDLSAGRNNLSRELAWLRQHLEPPPSGTVIAADRTTIALIPAAISTDVAAFTTALRAAESAGSPTERTQHLAEAIEGYGGELLPGHYEGWVLQEREWLADRYFQALGQLLVHLEQAGDLSRALEYARRGVRADPLREEAQRDLIRLLGAAGQPGAALRQYRELERLLKQELGTAPAAATCALAEEIERCALCRPVIPATPASPGIQAGVGEPRLPRHNLPLPLTSLIGREAQIADVRQLLSTSRLVTLTGAGGCGKTRLALQAATSRREEFADGAWLVELASLADPALVPQSVAVALGVREQPGCSLTQTVTEWLQSRHLLLVLDNCEHLVEACAHLAEMLLRACPSLRVLVTSREPLGIGGETPYRVPSLSLPDPQQPLTRECLLRSEAVRLFMERATTVQPRFTVTETNAAAVAQICRRLDGIPLAIELAAARVKALPIEQIVARLDDRFRLLTSGSRTALPRHQTLRGLIDWSYDLLSDAERRLLRRLSVFAGGWTLEAAEAVCAGEGTEEWEVLDLLTALVEKSVAVYEAQGAASRYRLLETIRQYARERLEESGEAAAIGRQHAQFFLALAEEAEPRLRTADRRVWLDQLQREYDNLRAALAWSHGEPEAREIELRLAGALWRFWFLQGCFSEGRQWLEEALAGIGAEAREEEVGFTRARAKVLYGVGMLGSGWVHPGARGADTLAAAQRSLEASVALWRALGDKQGLAASLRDLGAQTDAVALLEESVALSRELGDRYGLIHSLYHLGNAVFRLGDHEAARSCYTESLTIGRELGDQWTLARPLAGLGKWALVQGDYEAARAFYEESVFLRRQESDPWLPGFLRDLGDIARLQRDYERARAAFEEALIYAPERLTPEGRAWLLSDLGAVARCQGDEETARSFCEQSEAVFRELLGREREWASRSGECGEQAGGPRSTEEEREGRRKVARCLEGEAAVAVTRGEMARGARLLGAAGSVHDTSGMRTPWASANYAQYEGTVAAARAALGEAAFAAAWAAGRTLSLEQAIAYALDEQAASPSVAADLT